jgi:hypothetical protein
MDDFQPLFMIERREPIDFQWEQVGKTEGGLPKAFQSTIPIVYGLNRHPVVHYDAWYSKTNPRSSPENLLLHSLPGSQFGHSMDNSSSMHRIL